MLEIQTISEDYYNSIAPSVFIDNIYVTSGSLTVNFHLENDSQNWISQQNILEGLYVNIALSSSTSYSEKKNLLSSLNKSGQQLTGFYEFTQPLDENYSVVAYCGNENLIGAKTTEKIKENNKFVDATINNQQYRYISKIIDLTTLETSLMPTGSVTGTISTNEIDNAGLMISYRPDKKANIGILFNLETFLENNSRYYPILKNYNEFKTNILLNSYVDTANSSFYKKNISTQEKEYLKIYSDIQSYKMTDTKNIFLITLTDDNDDPNNESLYEIKCDIAVYDYSYELLSKYALERIKVAKKNIEEYKDLFVNFSKQELIKNVNNYIFQNEYQSRIEKIKQSVDYLSVIYSFLNNKTKAEYTKIFMSAMHPLVTNAKVLEQLLKSINNVENMFNSLANQINFSGTPDGNILENTLSLNKKTYYFSDKEPIDYSYEEKYGYDVYSTDSIDSRMKESTTGIRRLKYSNDRDARKILESRKYLTNPSQQQVTELQFFSISSLDLGQTSYNLSILSTDLNKFNEIFIKLSEHQYHNFNYPRLQSSYMQLSDYGISINNITNGTNQSTNNLIKSVIFDPNIDSQQASLEFISSTGVEKLFTLLSDDSNVKNITSSLPPDSLQFSAAFPTVSGTTNFALNENTLNNSDAIGKIVVYYQSVFKENAIFKEDNSNYDLYSLDATAAISSLFKGKIRQFNKHYLVTNKRPTTRTEITQNIDYNKELNLNIESKYINRTLSNPQLITTVESL